MATLSSADPLVPIRGPNSATIEFAGNE